MKNKLRIMCVIIMGYVLSFILVSCAPEKENVVVNVNTTNTNISTGAMFGKEALIEIGDSLWYDQNTRIVYWWNDALGYSQCSTTPTAYYAPNGLPYRYNPETNTFEEIGE